MATRANQPLYFVQLCRSAYAPDEVAWRVRKSWWTPRVGSTSRETHAGELAGIPEGLTEAELLSLVLEAVIRRLRAQDQG